MTAAADFSHSGQCSIKYKLVDITVNFQRKLIQCHAPVAWRRLALINDAPRAADEAVTHHGT